MISFENTSRCFVFQADKLRNMCSLFPNHEAKLWWKFGEVGEGKTLAIKR
jgi:hypothetical protein